MTILMNQCPNVENLLSLMLESLSHIKDEDLKERIKKVVDVYQEAISPSTVYLNDVLDMAKFNNIQISRQDAISILSNVALDIDLNYSKKSVEYHFDEFMLGR